MLFRTLAPLALIALMLGIAGCDDLLTKQTSDDDLTVMNEDEVAEAIKSQKVLLLDVRTAAKYEAGHLPGAVHMPIERMSMEDERLMGYDRIIVYGDGFFNTLSTAGAKKLIRLGYKNVYEFRGGVELWKDSGRELVGSGTTRSDSE